MDQPPPLNLQTYLEHLRSRQCSEGDPLFSPAFFSTSMVILLVETHARQFLIFQKVFIQIKSLNSYFFYIFQCLLNQRTIIFLCYRCTSVRVNHWKRNCERRREPRYVVLCDEHARVSSHVVQPIKTLDPDFRQSQHLYGNKTINSIRYKSLL